MLALGILLVGAVCTAAAVVVCSRALAPILPLRLVRYRAAAEDLARTIGRVPASLIVIGALSAFVVAVCWPLGRLAAHSEHWDRSVFRWVPSHQTGWLTSVMKALTVMGNRFEVKIVLLVACIGFIAVLRRGAVLPVLAMLGAFVLERQAQHILALVVHRGHPPTTLGTYPSGGCARLIALYGLLLFLVLHYWRPGRRVVVGAWSALAVAAWVEGYSRIYLEKHWASDVVGGWVFGALLLGAVVATSWVLLGAPGRGGALPHVRPASRRSHDLRPPAPAHARHAERLP